MSKQLLERNERIYELATRSQRSTGELAAEFGLSAPRIYQIVRSVGRLRHGASFTLEQLRRREALAGG